MTKQIILQDVSHIYNLKKANALKALSDISLTINQGELIAIVGKSGSGKTTLMNIIGGLLTQTSGTYLYDNQKVTPKYQYVLRDKKVGYVLQDFALLDTDTVKQNVALPLWIDRDTPIKTINDKVDNALKQMDIENYIKTKVKDLSGGQKQRVAIARALVKNVEVILADEPTGSLDNDNSQMIIDILKDINKKGITVVIITHDMSVAKQCRRLIELDDGKVISDTNLSDIKMV